MLSISFLLQISIQPPLLSPLKRKKIIFRISFLDFELTILIFYLSFAWHLMASCHLKGNLWITAGSREKCSYLENRAFQKEKKMILQQSSRKYCISLKGSTGRLQIQQNLAKYSKTTFPQWIPLFLKVWNKNNAISSLLGEREKVSFIVIMSWN